MKDDLNCHVRFKSLGPATARPRVPASALAAAAMTAGALALLLSAWALGSHLDAQDEAATHAHHLDALAFEAGRQEALRDLPMRLAAAYAAGLSDGVASMEGTPQGVVLAQACVAWSAQP